MYERISVASCSGMENDENRRGVAAHFRFSIVDRGRQAEIQASHWEVRRMRDLTRALEGLRDDLAATQREITVLEQISRELGKLVARFGAEADSLMRRHLEEIARRAAAALAKQASIAQMMEECGRERRSARAARPLPARRSSRPETSFLRQKVGRAQTP